VLNFKPKPPDSRGRSCDRGSVGARKGRAMWALLGQGLWVPPGTKGMWVPLREGSPWVPLKPGCPTAGTETVGTETEQPKPKQPRPELNPATWNRSPETWVWGLGVPWCPWDGGCNYRNRNRRNRTVATGTVATRTETVGTSETGPKRKSLVRVGVEPVQKVWFSNLLITFFRHTVAF